MIAEKLWNRDEIERFTLRVRGVPPEKPSRWCRTQYWDGSFTVPLSEVYQQIEWKPWDREAPMDFGVPE